LVRQTDRCNPQILRAYSQSHSKEPIELIRRDLIERYEGESLKTLKRVQELLVRLNRSASCPRSGDDRQAAVEDVLWMARIVWASQ